VTVELRLEPILSPVSEVDCGKEFCVEKAGINLGADGEPGEGVRVIQGPGDARSGSRHGQWRP
jgi:hypothetical protein